MLSWPGCKLAFMALTREAHKEAEATARAGFASRLRRAFVRAGRLQEKNGEPDRSWLAEELGISVQAVGLALDPSKPNVFSAYTNEKAARALGVDSYWLATGEDEPATATDSDVVHQMAQLLQDIARAPEGRRLHAIIAAIRAVAAVTGGAGATIHVLKDGSVPTPGRHLDPETEPR